MQTTFLVFGLTGDLMKKKGIPALFALWSKKQLPEDFKVVGLSRKEWSPEATQKYITDTIKNASDEARAFAGRFTIIQGEVSDKDAYTTLLKAVSGSVLVYLCVSPEFYAPIIENLSQHAMLKEARVLIEKPFGQDGKSAEALEEMLASHMSEEQIFRIDHYLAKEGVLTLVPGMYLPRDIGSIEVYLLEKGGVESRGAVYDALGCLRDVGQNHLLQMAALSSGIRRADALKQLHILSPEEVASHTRRAQYEGYEHIEGVAPGSQTETYFSLNTALSIPLYEVEIGVTLEAGKALKTARKEIILRKKDLSTIVIPLESKQNEYELLFADALRGDHAHFVSREEISLEWAFIDPILSEWKKGAAPLLHYAPDSDQVRSSNTI